MRIIKIENNKVKDFSPNGTSLIDCLDISYEKLVKVFGEPNQDTELNSKVDAEWVILTDYGIATIYNYKTGKSYLGDKGKAVEDIRDWHIGGKDKAVANCIKQALA